MSTNTDLDNYLDELDHALKLANNPTLAATGEQQETQKHLRDTKWTLDNFSTESIKLYEVRSLQPWERVPCATKESALQERVVFRLDCVMTGALCSIRMTTTPRLYLREIKQMGMISDLCSMKVFKTPAAPDIYFLCSAMVRRLDAATLLSGNFLFRFISPKKEWREDTIHDTVKYDEAIAKVTCDGVEVMQEEVVLESFFFDIVAHAVSLPMLQLNFL